MEGFLWPVVIFLSIVGIVGLPGNILIILVYARKRQTRSYQVFVLALAVADLMVCLLTPVTVYNRYSHENQFLCRLAIAVSYVTVYNSCFLTSAIAVDRYLAICRPLRRLMTVRRAKLTVLLCLVAAVIVSSPVVAIYDVVFTDGGGNGTCTLSQDTPTWVANLTSALHYVFSLSALAVSVVSYGKVYRAIRKQARVRPGDVAASAASAGRSSRNLSLRQMMSQNPMLAPSEEPLPTVFSVSSNRRLQVPASEHQQHRSVILRAPQMAPNSEQNRLFGGTNHHSTGEGQQQVALPAAEFQRSTTRMLAVTSAVFLFTWLLTLFTVSVQYVLYGTFAEDLESYKDNQIGAAFLFLFINIVFLNNAINPFIYCFMNRRFRTDCAKAVSALWGRCL